MLSMSMCVVIYMALNFCASVLALLLLTGVNGIRAWSVEYPEQLQRVLLTAHQLAPFRLFYNPDDNDLSENRENVQSGVAIKHINNHKWNQFADVLKLCIFIFYVLFYIIAMATCLR